MATQLWPAATYLCNYFENNYDKIFSSYESVNIIELGAGIG